MAIDKAKYAEIDSVVSYMAISFGYDYNIVLPYKDGVALLTSLEKAESIDRYYSGSKVIFNDTSRQVEICVISQKDYREQKMAKLLGVPDGI